MRITFLLIALLVWAVFINKDTVPIIPPWSALSLPATEQTCRAAKGSWIKASDVAHPFTPEIDYEPAHCQMIYADAGVACQAAAECSSKTCIVHPIKRKGSCLGILPPRGFFEFLDNKGNVRSANLLL